MSLVRLEKVTKRFAGLDVLCDVDFRVEEGEKIGLIGLNGTGKTTVLRIIDGEIEPDAGVVERMRKIRIAHHAQFADVAPDATVMEIALVPFRELLELERELGRLERDMAGADEKDMTRYSELQDTFSLRGGYEFRARAKATLLGLGFVPDNFDMPFDSLSGGQRSRLRLARTLLEQADLLMLDEPENHLDVNAREWLESFLREWPKAFVMISHDRQMLDNVVTRVSELERTQIRSFKGGYSAYMRQKDLLREQQQKAFDRQQEFVEKEQRWIDRFRYKNTKAKQVQSRIKRLDKMDRVEAPVAQDASADFSMRDVTRSGFSVIEATGLSMAFDDLTLYEGFSMQVHRGERIGIVGPNGSGKTTLLRHLAGQLPNAAGTVLHGHKVDIGFYHQHQQDLNPANEVLAEVASADQRLTPEQVRSFLGRLLFFGDDVFKLVSSLSGGELSRVAIAKLILSGANVLMLDEPTNHLDILSREVLEDVLGTFPGSTVLVSHDRTLIDRLSDKLVIVENGEATMHLGNYSDYRWRLSQEGKCEEQSPEPKARSKASRGRQTAKSSAMTLKRQQKELKSLESDIEVVEEHIADLEAQFGEIEPSDYEAGVSLKQEYEGLRKDLQEMYLAWEQLCDSIAEGSS